MQGLVAINGKVTPPEQALVPALDRGLLFGDGVFEVLVAFGGQLLDVDRHCARLRASAETLAFDIPWSDAELEFELKSLVEQLAAPKAYVRLAVTRGSGLGVRPQGNLQPNRYVYCMPAPVDPPHLYSDGMALKRVVQPGTHRGAAPKTGNYLASIMALNRAKHDDVDDVLWTNADGEITEASTANIFFMARDGDNYEVVTPPPASGILLGITRDTILQLLRMAGIPVREQVLFVDELPRFDEAFLCSTVRGLVPVSRIDRHRLHGARAGSVFRHIERLFLTWTETQLGWRVDWATGRRL